MRFVWPKTEEQALNLQTTLASQIEESPIQGPVRLIAGLDVAYDDADDSVIAAVSVFNADTLKLIETRTIRDQVSFPYIPGLFSFRELPPLLKALNSLATSPDLLICDGHGRAHPRRFGLACHLGLVTGIPSIGCAKTPFYGDFNPPGKERGDWSPIVSNGETLGAVLRTQTDVNPVYVSVGHGCTLVEAIDFILHMSPKYRLPETTRSADQAVRRAMKRD